MKVTDKIYKQGVELAGQHGFKRIFVNEKGEFFSNQSYAAHSVGGDMTKYAEIAIGTPVDPTATNDLGKAADVIAAIEASTDVEEVRAILEAEVAGKDRVTVIEAASKKIATLTPSATVTTDDPDVIKENPGTEPLNTVE